MKIWIEKNDKMTDKLKDLLGAEKYEIDYLDDLDLTVSKMGRKRLVNIPARLHQYQRGQKVRLLKMDGSGPRGQRGRCLRNRNI